jgi:hypothetical protein
MSAIAIMRPGVTGSWLMTIPRAMAPMPVKTT